MRRRRWWPGHAVGEPVSCEVIRESISAALDGETPGTRAKVFKAHLERCPECQRFEAEVITLAHRVVLQDARSAPDALKELLVTESARTAAPVRLLPPRASWRISHGFGWRRVGRWIGALAPAAIVAVVVPMGAWSSTPGRPTHPTTPCTAQLRSHHGPQVVPNIPSLVHHRR
ncbi:MAG: zf-HC2 domain-containing protein [Acidimicrobiales bacterium]